MSAHANLKFNHCTNKFNHCTNKVACAAKRTRATMAATDRDYATGKLVDFGKPEEKVRQDFERVLVEGYGYRVDEIDIEFFVPRGSGLFPDRADIVVFRDSQGKDAARDIVGIVETKRKDRKDGLEQIKSYMTATSADWGVWTNGDDIAYLCKRGNQVLDGYLNNIPVRGQSVEDVGQLERSDLRPFGRSELKLAFRRILERLRVNANITRREKLGSEMIRILFAKIEDERTFMDNPPQFRAAAGEPSEDVADRVKMLFRRVKNAHMQDGVFADNEEIMLDADSIAWVVGQLERGSLMDSDSDVVGDAFEVFAESKFAGEGGEFFTPRGVVRIAVKLADPGPNDRVCDPACGSGGFLIYAMDHIWRRMDEHPQWRNSPDIVNLKKSMAARSIFGIDKENDLAKIAKAQMAIAGDGKSNIVHHNSLHAVQEFEGDAKQIFTNATGFEEFDVVLTNPPFGSKVKVDRSESGRFRLGRRWRRDGSSVWATTGATVERDPYILFVERCLDLLKNGGTLAIVLPETVFHGEQTGFLRQFIQDGNDIVAVVDLPHNTFRPHCNAKTCLLVMRKGVAQRDRVVMATPKEMGHDHKGRELVHPGTEVVWDDLAGVYDELDRPASVENRHVFELPWSEVQRDVLVPRYYRSRIHPIELPPGRSGVRLGDLVDQGAIAHFPGHGSPPAVHKGEGPIPYVRVADIVNWELYRNPVAGMPYEIFEKMTRGKELLNERDVVFVRRGSYRIGTVAMASRRDREVILMRELSVFRVKDTSCAPALSPFYLLALLSSKFVQDQLEPLTFIDTTLPNMGNRWREIVLPFHDDLADASRISDAVEEAVRAKWSAQKQIDDIQEDLGGLVR